jgi:hypothetical protein
VTWSRRLKDALLSLLVVLGVVVALFTAIGVLTFMRHVSCGRLDAERISHLEPGFETPGPGSIHVIGVGPGPPKSEIIPYLEAEQAMVRAGCQVPALVGSSSGGPEVTSGEPLRRKDQGVGVGPGRGTGIASPAAPGSDVSFAMPARSSISMASRARRTRSRLSATAVCSRCVPDG